MNRAERRALSRALLRAPALVWHCNDPACLVHERPVSDLCHETLGVSSPSASITPPLSPEKQEAPGTGIPGASTTNADWSSEKSGCNPDGA